MRLVAVTLTAVALLAAPAYAITRTVHVPVLNCDVTVNANSMSVSANHRRGVWIDRWGDNGATTDC
jgi:hypothetical protein